MYWVICINVGANCARAKKIRLRTKSGTFPDLAGRGTSGKKAGLSRQKRDGWQACEDSFLTNAEKKQQIGYDLNGTNEH